MRENLKENLKENLLWYLLESPTQNMRNVYCSQKIYDKKCYR